MTQLLIQTRDTVEGLIEDLREGIGEGEDANDLHHALANVTPFIIGTYNAEKWLDDQAFAAIGLIAEWEKDNMGEVTTDFSDAEKVANLTYYLLAEKVLQDSKHLEKLCEEGTELQREDLDVIANEIEGSLYGEFLDHQSVD